MDNLSPTVIIVIVVLVLVFIAYVISPIRKRIKQIGVKVGQVVGIDIKAEGKPAEGEDFGLPRGLNLTESETDCMLWMAIRPVVKYPLCKHPAVSHAAGSAVAGLITSAMVRKVSNLRDQFNTCGRQMLIEDDYNSDRLEEYTYDLLELKGALVNLAESSHSSSLGRQNLVSEVFGKLQKGNKILCGEIRQIQETIESKINAMLELLDDISRSGEKRKNKIKKIFKENGKEVQLLGERLEVVVKEIGSFGVGVKTDWDCDLDEVWDKKSCKSEKPRKCGCLEQTSTIV